jgi:hypothetical protein
MHECIGFLAHEFRNLTHTSLLALEALTRATAKSPNRLVPYWIEALRACRIFALERSLTFG